MFYVYVLIEVLIERKSSRHYIGFTADLKQRVAQHQQGKGAKYTQAGQWHLVYYEAYLSKKDAIVREKKLKQHGNARRQLLIRITDSIDWIKIGAGEADD